MLEVETKIDQRPREGLGGCPVLGMWWKKDVGWMLAEVEKGEDHNSFNEIKLLHLLHHLLGRGRAYLVPNLLPRLRWRRDC